MNFITIQNRKYISGDDILKNAPFYSKVCRSSRDLLRKKNIPISDYIYARNVNDKWQISSGSSSKFDKVFVVKEYLINIPELNINNKEKIVCDDGIEKAPNIIILDDSEKFKDDDGNLLEIETRGVREYNKIFFKVKDVAISFNIDRLQDIILMENTNYNINTHYKYFACEKLNDLVKNTTKEVVKKDLFLTYEGILRVLFVTRNGKTSKFIKWATETLFAIQLGTKEQKQKIVSDILGVGAKVVKEVFNCDTNTLPCVYLFTLGYVKDLRESMNIEVKYEDNFIVAKYGRTDNLSRRTKEHLSHYKKIKNSDLKLKHYCYIDPQYISSAENDIKNFIECLGLKFNYNSEEEIIIIPNDVKYLKLISEKFDHIGKKYSGHITELIMKIKDLEGFIEKQELKHNFEKDKLLSDLVLQKEKYEHELLKKDYKLLKYQNDEQ